MLIKNLNLLSIAGILAIAVGAGAQEITGVVQIEKKLTKRSVTAAVPMYQRGTAAKLAAPAEEDPLAFERSRVVLYLEGPGPSGKAEPPAMRQIDRSFSPDLLVIPRGTAVSFPNMDPVFHNVFSLSKAKSFDLGSYDKGSTRTVTFPNAGIVFVNCHLHPNMSATVVITPNRWYAQADASGKFRIPNVPPGEYTIVAWHKAAGLFKKTIRVEAGHENSINFFLPIRDEEPKDKAGSVSANMVGSR